MMLFNVLHFRMIPESGALFSAMKSKWVKPFIVVTDTEKFSSKKYPVKSNQISINEPNHYFRWVNQNRALGM